MEFKNSEMQQYYESLPRKAQYFINESKAKISTLDDLMKIGEQIKQRLLSDSRY